MICRLGQQHPSKAEVIGGLPPGVVCARLPDTPAIEARGGGLGRQEADAAGMGAVSMPDGSLAAARSAKKPASARRPWRFPRVTAWISMLLAAVILGSGLRPANAAVLREAPEPVLKAATVYGIAIFVEWPRTKFPEKDSPIVIGVLGNDAVAEGLDAIARSGQKIGGRSFTVLPLKPGDDIQKSHVLFVGGNREFNALLKPAELGNVLTIGEQSNFAERGGMANLVLVKGRIKFDVNKGATDKAGLKVSSKLLKAGRKIIDTPPVKETR